MVLADPVENVYDVMSVGLKMMGMHWPEDVEPVCNVYVFDGHAIHDALPEEFLYVPRAHTVHACPEAAFPLYPAGQTQDCMEVAPVDSVEAPSGHAVQAWFPAAALYVPGPQAVQMKPLPDRPAKQVQEKDPGELEHEARASQPPLLLLHSLTSSQP
jgi:hypothetical protein